MNSQSQNRSLKKMFENDDRKDKPQQQWAASPSPPNTSSRGRQTSINQPNVQLADVNIVVIQSFKSTNPIIDQSMNE